MNVFTNLLFLRYLTQPHTLDADERQFARGYGNRAASEQAFAPLGHAHARERASSEVGGEPRIAFGGCA